SCTPGKYTDLSQRRNSAHHDNHMLVLVDNPHLEFQGLSFFGHQIYRFLSSTSDLVQENKMYQYKKMYYLSDSECRVGAIRPVECDFQIWACDNAFFDDVWNVYMCVLFPVTPSHPASVPFPL